MRVFRIVVWIAILNGVMSARAWAADPQLDWDDLRDIATKTVANQDTVIFAPAVKALDGQIVTISGWITPINLGDGPTVTSFLLTGTPGTCPFCAGFGPESFVLVTVNKPVPSDPTARLLLVGRFKVSAADATGFYYRLQNALTIP